MELGGKLGICYPASITYRNLTSTRAQCSTDAIHAPFVAGISGSSTDGAYSVALSGGYDDDVDLGYALCVAAYFINSRPMLIYLQHLYRKRRT